MSSVSRVSRAFLRTVLVVLLAMAVAVGWHVPSARAAAPVTVSLVFNDGLASQHRNAAPLLQSRGLDGTFYVASSWVKTFDANYMRAYQLDELYRQGNEIGGMGKDHRNLTATYDADPAADLAYKRDQVCGDFRALTEWGYHPVSFAYPESDENAAAQQLVRDCGFTTGRVAGGLAANGPAYAEPIPAANPLRLRSTSIPAPGPLTLADLQATVVAAGANGGGWLPIDFNQVCSSADASYASCMGAGEPIDATVLAQFLDWLNTQAAEGVTVRTVRQVMASEQPPLPDRPFVATLTFDDGLRSQYALRDEFASHGMHGTFYINSGAVDAQEEGVMTWPQIRDLQAAGHDIGGHTRDHVNLLDSGTSLEFKTRQTCDDRQRLLQEGVNAVSFAYPFGAMDQTAEPIPRGCGYQSARKAGTVTSDGPIFSETIPVTENPYAIRILGTNYDGPVTLEALQHAVNQAILHGGNWLPMLFHEICQVGTPSYTSCMNGYRPVDDATIDAFLGWLASQASRNITVRTIADVMGGGSTAPRVTVATPQNGSTATSNRPTVSGTATGSGDVTVRLYDGDFSTGTALTTLTTSVQAGTWSVQPTNALPDGRYTVQASQGAGSATGTSVPLRFTVNATTTPTDTTAPTVAVTSPASGATVTSVTPTLSGTAGTAAGDVADVQLRLYAGTAATGTPVQTATATVAPGGTWSTAASALAGGVYTLVASQRDQAGNIGSSAPVTFTVSSGPVDTTAPQVTVTAPAGGSTVTTATPTVSGTAGRAAGDAGQVTVTLTPAASTTGGTVQTRTATVTTAGTWSLTATALAAGSWTVQATQSDTAGNVGSSTPTTFTVSTTPTDTTAPTVTITTPAAGASVGTAAVAVTGRAGTATGDQPTVRLQVFSGSAATGTPVSTSTLAVTAGAWSGSLAGLPAGTYTLVASQVDVAGNQGTSAARTFTKVASPTVTAVSPNALGRGAANATVTVTGTGFTSSSTATFSGTGVSSTITSRTATRLTLRVSVTTGATLGARNLTVTGSGGGTVTCTGCLSVVAGPTITAVSPTTVRRGRSTTVTLTGTQYRAGQMRVAVSGTGVTVGTVTVLSSTRLTVVLQVGAFATLSARNLTVTDAGTFGQATRSSAVTVVP